MGVEDDEASLSLAKPVGRRIFLALLGVGAAGFVFTQRSLRGDDTKRHAVAEAVPPDTANFSGADASQSQHSSLASTDRFRYYSVADPPDYHPATWRLTVDGEGVDRRLSIDLAQLKSYPNVALKATFRCVTGWRVRDNHWRGVRVRDVLDGLQCNGKARFVTFYSGDGVYIDSLTMKQARSDNAILAWELNGAPLIREQGYPLRLIYPDMFGYKNVKWVERMEVKSQRDIGFWEQQGWDVDGHV